MTHIGKKTNHRLRPRVALVAWVALNGTSSILWEPHTVPCLPVLLDPYGSGARCVCTPDVEPTLRTQNILCTSQGCIFPSTRTILPSRRIMLPSRRTIRLPDELSSFQMHYPHSRCTIFVLDARCQCSIWVCYIASVVQSFL